MSPRKKLSENESEFIKGGSKPPAGKPAQSKEDILSQILKPAPPEPKEASIRFTADLPLALHRRLTLAAAKAGKSKVDLVREFLDAVLPAED